jgi:hydroxymethylpyrimidine/phosphomethylpyrimidine kinase
MVLQDIGADAVKIGMIGSAETANRVAERLERLDDIPIVFDPVMIASSGAVLADDEVIRAFGRLMAIASVTTPNRMELEALSGESITHEVEQALAAEDVMQRYGARALLAKGGHAEGVIRRTTAEGETYEYSADERVFDYLYTSGGEYLDMVYWEDARIATLHDHGTGCTLASAIAVGLARKLPLGDAIAVARKFVRAAMEAAPGFGGGHGPMGHTLGAIPFDAIHRKSH